MRVCARLCVWALMHSCASALARMYAYNYHIIYVRVRELLRVSHVCNCMRARARALVCICALVPLVACALVRIMCVHASVCASTRVYTCARAQVRALVSVCASARVYMCSYLYVRASIPTCVRVLV